MIHPAVTAESMHGVDFVFEEASSLSLGPSKAEDLAISMSIAC
jgi:hypothetical protein